MVRASRADAKQSNRVALLSAAREVVTREGAAASLASIAAAADLTTGAIYSIFGSKQDLLGELLMEDVTQGTGLGAEAADPGLPIADMLARCGETWLRRYRHAFYEQGAFELQIVLAATQDARLNEKIATAMRAEVDQLAELLYDRPASAAPDARRTTKAEAQMLATVLKAMLSGFAFRHLMLREPLPEAILSDACRCLASLVTGLSGPAGPASPDSPP
ncbi:MAG: TetR/AcrR family transcriptional regulator [Streptosporangiaceae bacterium]